MVVLKAQNTLKRGDRMSISLKALRVNANLSRLDVLKRLKEEKGIELAENTLANYENKTSQPKIDTAKALASLYGVSVDEIKFS